MDGRVAIVGGAIVGSFVAWQLRRQGWRGPITVIERDPSYRRSSTALSAASIRTQFGTPVNIALSLYAVGLFRALREHFGEGADIGYREGGYLILGAPGAEAARKAGLALQRSRGAEVEWLTPGALAARFPFLRVEDLGLGTFGRGGEGWFDAWSLLALVRRAAQDAGVDYVTAEAAGLRAQGDRVRAVRLSDGAEVPCDWGVIAAGAASGRFLAPLGIDLAVSPRKRTVFRFRAPVERAGFPMLFDISGVWVRPEGEGFIGGIQPPADRDPDATDDFEPHHDLFEETFWPLLAHRVPGMERLRLEGAWAGHYEVNALDHNGVVGPHDGLANLVLATGFSGHGVMHAPGVGRGVAEWIATGGYRTLDLGPLGWERVRDRRPLVETVVY